MLAQKALESKPQQSCKFPIWKHTVSSMRIDAAHRMLYLRTS